MVEARELNIFMNHNPPASAFHKKNNAHHLHFVIEIILASSDVQQVSGSDNVFAYEL